MMSTGRGERRGQKAHKRGLGSANKTPFVDAVAVNKEGYSMRMQLCVFNGFRSKEISSWAKCHIAPGSRVVSDGLACFSAVKEAGCSHHAIVTGGGPVSVARKEFIWVNMMIGNVKNALIGTYHAINHKHLPRYLTEFCYRLNLALSAGRCAVAILLCRYENASHAITPSDDGCELWVIR